MGPTVDEFTMRGPDISAPCRTVACSATYEYDPRERLISHDDGQGSAGTTFDYSLDVVGNIVEEQATTASGLSTTTYEYLGNQLQSLTADGVTQRYFYDPNGNLACITLETGDPSDCPITSGAAPSSEVLAAYEYDPLDRLVGYRSFVTDGSTSEPDDAAIYQYDALDRVLEQTESHQRLTSVDERHTVMRYLGLSNLVTGEDHYEGDDPTPGTELTTKSYSYDAWGHRISLTDIRLNWAPAARPIRRPRPSPTPTACTARSACSSTRRQTPPPLTATAPTAAPTTR